MELNLLDRLGDWNPQLFRELKGRFKPRNVLMAIALSIVSQGLLLFIHYENLPSSVSSVTSHIYCTGREQYGRFECIRNAVGDYLINWQDWWMNLYIYLSIISIFALGIGGTYLIIQNLSCEERNGTLNFIRLSPRSTLEIVLGKLLGVPSLLYLTVALILPLQWLAGLQAHLSPLYIIECYILVIACCALYFCAAMALSFLSGRTSSESLQVVGAALIFVYLLICANVGLELASQPVLTWFFLFSPFAWLNSVTDMVSANADTLYALGHIASVQWFGFPISTTAALLGLATLLNCIVWTSWLGRMLERRFRNPNSTVLSKRQSYAMTMCFELMILGFVIPPTLPAASSADWWQYTYAAELILLNLLYCGFLITTLLPSRQLMQDWARYRHQYRYNSAGRRSPVWLDLLRHDKSPAPVAIGVNFAIVIGALALWLLFALPRYHSYFIYSLLLTMGMLLLCAAIAQYIMSLRISQQSLWAAVGVAIVIVAPIIIAIPVSANGGASTLPIWLFTILPWIGMEQATAPMAVGIFLAQLSLVTVIYSALSHRLQKFGESETKALLSSVDS
jgi:hypothetical protein